MARTYPRRPAQAFWFPAPEVGAERGVCSTLRTMSSTPRKPKPGYDASGHMDPAYVARLRELGQEGRDVDPEAFLDATGVGDDLAEELAEAAVATMTSGEEELLPQLEAEVAEDDGGPFIETSGNTEFAGGTDESNIADATREPFPLANGGKGS